MLQVVNEFERIGDHADNICDCAEEISAKGVRFSDTAVTELNAISDAVQETVEHGQLKY